MTEKEHIKHTLVPKHTILSEEKTKEILNKFNISKKQLPKVLATDIIVKTLGAQSGDVLAITRKSPTADESTYYRVVVNA